MGDGGTDAGCAKELGVLPPKRRCALFDMCGPPELAPNAGGNDGPDCGEGAALWKWSLVDVRR